MLFIFNLSLFRLRPSAESFEVLDFHVAQSGECESAGTHFAALHWRIWSTIKVSLFATVKGAKGRAGYNESRQVVAREHF